MYSCRAYTILRICDYSLTQTIQFRNSLVHCTRTHHSKPVKFDFGDFFSEQSRLFLVTWQVFFFQFRHSAFSKNKFNLTIDPLSLGIYALGPQILTYRPQILRGARIWTSFRIPSPNEEIIGSGVSGSEGDNSPFRCARPNLTSYSDSR